MIRIKNGAPGAVGAQPYPPNKDSQQNDNNDKDDRNADGREGVNKGRAPNKEFVKENKEAAKVDDDCKPGDAAASGGSGGTTTDVDADTMY